MVAEIAGLLPVVEEGPVVSTPKGIIRNLTNSGKKENNMSAMGSITCFDRIMFVSRNSFLISFSLGFFKKKENICYLEGRHRNGGLLLNGQHLSHTPISSEIVG